TKSFPDSGPHPHKVSSSGGTQNLRHGGGDGVPSLFFRFELATPLECQLVEACTAPRFRHTPLGFEQSGFRHAVESGIERACLDAKNLVGCLLDVRRECEAVVRAAPEDLHHKKLQRALKVVYFSHGIDI